MWNWILLSEAKWKTSFTLAVYMHINIIFKYARTYFAYCSLNKGGRFLSRHRGILFIYTYTVYIYIYTYIIVFTNITYSLVWKKRKRIYVYSHIIFTHTNTWFFGVHICAHTCTYMYTKTHTFVWMKEEDSFDTCSMASRELNPLWIMRNVTPVRGRGGQGRVNNWGGGGY